MQIKQDPITKLWCREDGAVLMPPCPNICRFRHTWTFGSKNRDGYMRVQFRGKHYAVHRIICRAFHGLPPADKPEVDHINRIKSANFESNLRWTSRKENADNQASVDKSVEKYKVRACENKTAYTRAHRETHREEYNACGRLYYGKHREERKTYLKAYGATKRAEMKAQGLTRRKGPDGKWGWFPFKRTQSALESTIAV